MQSARTSTPARPVLDTAEWPMKRARLRRQFQSLLRTQLPAALLPVMAAHPAVRYDNPPQGVPT